MTGYPKIRDVDLEAICKIMADTDSGLTGSEIASILNQCRIQDVSPTSTKRVRLYEALRQKQEEDKCANNILNFIKGAMAPQRFIGKSEYYYSLRFRLNQALSFAGYELDEDGRLKIKEPVTSLKDLGSFGYKSHTLSSIFKSRNFKSDESLVFIAIPLNSQFKRICDEYINPVLKNNGFNGKRSDQYFKTGAIIEQIWEWINQAAFIIGDVTGKNPNVFYELGLAHAIGKECIILTQNENDVPFDIKHLRYIMYSDDEFGWLKLSEELTNFLQSIE